MAMRLDEYIGQGQRADVKDEQPVSKSMRLGDFMAQEKQVVENPELITELYQPTQKQTAAWKEKGKIGYFDQAVRMNKKRLIPFYFGDSVKMFKTWKAVNRLTADDYKADKEAKGQDIQKINDFLELLAEENTRGFTVGGRITQGIGELPAYLTEFLATGGIANVGKQAVRESVKKSLRTIVKSGTKKFVTRVAGGVAKATMRTAAMPHRVLASGSQKALYAKLDFTDKGYDLLKEAREAPAISFLKGAGDVVIENFSEEAGFYLGKYANKLLPRRLTSGLAKIYKKFHPSDNIAKFMKNTRVWNGFLNEMGEERLGDFLRAVFKVEDFGAKTPESMVDRLISSIPNGEELMIEAAVLAFPGGANMLASNAITKYRTLTGKKAELDDMPEELDKEMPDEEIDTFMATQAEKDAEQAEIEAPEGVGEAKPGVEGVVPAPAAEEDIVGYRSEEVYGEKFRDIEAVTRHEIEELGNEDIIDTLLEKGYIKDKSEWPAFIKGLKDKGYDKVIWLSPTKEAVVEEYGVTPESVEEYKKKGIVISDLGEEGRLIAYKSEPTKAPAKARIPAEEKQLLEDIKELEERKLYGKVPMIIKKETTVLREKIANIERGIREGRITTQKEIKETQTAVIKLIESTELEAADRAKFIKTIKNIQTPEQLQKALPEIKDRMIRLETAAEKRGIAEKIKKELKTTKPLKVGQRRVGKFDYETNKMFDTLRDYNKLTQANAQAEFDKFPEEVATEIDLIKKRFLSLKANGASASAEIHRQVYADIMRIKRLGKEAKDEADLEKKLNRQERVENALSSIDKITGTKKSVMGKIANAYRKGFSNIYSMLNSIAGKDFAEAYDPELSENKRNTATYKKTLEITVESSKIYNEKNVMRMFETMSQKDYQITDIKDGLTTELSKLEIIDIYNSIKNDKKKQDYYEAFGEAQVQNLIVGLTAKDRSFADSLQTTVQGYREILNKRNIEITGRDLGFIENYWPATSEFQVSVIDDMRVQGETPSALKERAKTKVIPVPKNAWYKAQRHIAQAEHVDKIGREYEALKRMFTDRKVKHAIKEKFGEDVYNTMMAQIENISLNKQTERIDAISNVFQKAINNWVTAKIALNPSTYVRQLMSVGNYAEHMGSVEWTTGFFEGIFHPKRTFDYMWKNAPFLEARFNKGYSEALKEAIEGAERISVNKQIWTKFLTSLARSGDITAIIYGGYPLMKKSGLAAFESATLKSQQSGLSSSISQFQNSRNPFTRLFLAFKNTSNQYFRKMADAVISYQNKDISLEQFAKTMTIYAIIQPILYAAAGYATKEAFGLLGSAFGKEDDEDDEGKLLNDIMVQLIVSPVNSIPLINDAVRAAGRKATGQKVYQFLSIPWLDDLERAGRAMLKVEVTGNDYLKMMSAILEPATGIPVGTGIRYYEILTGKKIGGKKSGKTLVR